MSIYSLTQAIWLKDGHYNAWASKSAIAHE